MVWNGGSWESSSIWFIWAFIVISLAKGSNFWSNPKQLKDLPLLRSFLTVSAVFQNTFQRMSWTTDEVEINNYCFPHSNFL